MLYVRGNIELLDRCQISIVGSRRPTPYGNQTADRLARDLADRGLVIVSGLAHGAGSWAHNFALSSAAGATHLGAKLLTGWEDVIEKPPTAVTGKGSARTIWSSVLDCLPAKSSKPYLTWSCKAW